MMHNDDHHASEVGITITHKRWICFDFIQLYKTRQTILRVRNGWIKDELPDNEKHSFYTAFKINIES